MSNKSPFQDEPNILPKSRSKQIVALEWHWLVFVLPCEKLSAASRKSFWDTYMSQVARWVPSARENCTDGSLFATNLRRRIKDAYFCRPEEEPAKEKVKSGFSVVVVVVTG
jgi:hypothetical protein